MEASHPTSSLLSLFQANLEKEKQFTNTKRPLEVRVHRKPVIERPSLSSDQNNNQTRVLSHPPNILSPNQMTSSFHFLFDLPPISLFFAVLQIAIYFFKDKFHVITEEDVWVSWQTVITHGEIGRLFYAQFFNFGRVLIFFNVVTLMAMGRHLERKIQKPAYVFLILLMSVISNLLYIFLNDIFCSGPYTEYTVGFSTTMFALRMIHIFTMDSEANNGRGEPNLILGFIPVYLPVAIVPWQPLLETIFFDVAVIGRCVAANISGMCAALFFPYLMKHYRHYIMLPRNPPPPPPRWRSRTTMARRSSDSNNNNSSMFSNDNIPFGSYYRNTR